jgi:hypothetical protein
MKRITTPNVRLSLGGHRTLTIFIVALVLFVAACVYFVNSVVISPHSDDAYRHDVENKASLINFNMSLLKKAQAFSARSTDTSLPAGRIDPFSS